MNSENDQSPTSPKQQDLNTSLATVESSLLTNMSDFSTQPLTTLVGQCPKPMEQMTEAELREFVQQVQNNRASSQTFRASVVAKAEQVLEKVRKVETVEGFEELL